MKVKLLIHPVQQLYGQPAAVIELVKKITWCTFNPAHLTSICQHFFWPYMHSVCLCASTCACLLYVNVCGSVYSDVLPYKSKPQ